MVGFFQFYKIPKLKKIFDKASFITYFYKNKLEQYETE